MTNKKRYYFSLLVYLFVSVALFAQEADSLPNVVETQEFTASKENVKFLGRSYYSDDKLWLCYSSTGAEFNISSKKLDITFLGDANANSRNKDGAARLVVFVNGERKIDEMLYKRKQTFTVFEGQELVEGVVQVIKVSESANSIVGIEKIIVDKDGKISPTAEKELKIEFIGDSITCGYGVDDLNRNNHFSTRTEDNTKTYAYKTAKALNADYSMVSISGWGIISGYSGDGKKQGNSVIPTYYDKLGFCWNGRINNISPQSIDWDFSEFQPDFVVVNLGTNDDSYVKSDKAKTREYIDGYKNFLKVIREKNPNAYIICSLGMMGQNLCPAIEIVVSEYKNETGDERISSLKFQNQNMSDGIAADWHPSEKTHEKAGKLLTEKIKLLQ